MPDDEERAVMTTMRRRQFLRTAVASTGAMALAGSMRALLAGAAPVPGPGPYGPLSAAPDAHGFHLPAGFTSRLLAVSGQAVGSTGHTWHLAPDGGACFPSPGGGWVYVSNSELGSGAGGAGALRFDASGTIIGAHRILSGTNRNCSGGRTIAGTWLSCEENGATGRVFECDPQAAGQGILRAGLGLFSHEGAMEDPVGRAVYLTEDDPAGRLYRFVPSTPGNLSSGRLYAAAVSNGSVTWVPSSAAGPDRQLSTTAFNGGEGIWIEGRSLYFTTKGDKRVWLLDLDSQALTVLFDGVATPTAALDAVDQCTVHTPSGDLFVCEDGGNMEIGIIAAAAAGLEVAAFLRIVGHAASEWTGLAFSPDHRRMYVSSQRGTDGVHGRTYEITGPFRSVSRPAPPETLVTAGSAWRYRDTGADLGTAWRALYFDDTAWSSGTASFGYGDLVSTTVAFGPAASAKYITTYFRRSFTASHGFSALTLLLRRDDGAVVYVNGTEAARSNMPAGSVSAATPATAALGGADETTVVRIPISATLYQGTNVIAVEVHQAAATSSDLAFDLALVGTGHTGALAAPPPRPSTTVAIADDANVRDGSSAASNFGTAASAHVQTGATGANRWYYVKVSTAAHRGRVTKAVVRLLLQSPGGAATTLSLYPVALTTWGETTITWNNRPARGKALASATVSGTTAVWREFDVTAYVAAERAAGRSLVSFCLAAPAPTSLVVVGTAETTNTALRPRLVITA